MSSRVDRRTWIALAGSGVAGFAFGQKAKDKRPITGIADEKLAPLDDHFHGFLKEHKLPGLAVALARKGKLVYSRGFGSANPEKKLPMQPNSQFRIASISKCITSTAIFQLIEKKLLTLDTPLLDVLTQKPFLAAKAKVDPRWKKATVKHALQHSFGHDRDASGDPIADIWGVAKAMGTTPPLSTDQLTRYILGLKLDFEPGEKYAYGNLGYLLLGKIIEKLTKKRYGDAIKDSIWTPLKVTTASLARGTPPNRPKAEVAYLDTPGNTGTSLYPPTVGQTVPTPDGGSNIEAYDSFGGWVCSAIDLVRFARTFDDPKASPLLKAESITAMWARPEFENGGKPKPTYYGCGWNVREIDGDKGLTTWHYGLLSGVSTVLVRRFDGFCWAILLNADYLPGTKTEIAGEVAESLHDVVDGIRDWPETDQFRN